MYFYTRKSKLVKELRSQLSAAEETIQTLQTEAQKERQERAALEKALLEATDTSSAAEKKIQTLQTVAQKEKKERAALEEALLEATNTSRPIQEELIQRIARLEVDLEKKQPLLEATSSAAEQQIKALQTEAQKEREETAALERALLETTDTSRSIQEELNQRNARLQVELETSKQAGQNALDVKGKQLQKLQENMLQLQQEMATFQKCMREEEERAHMLQETLSQERNTSQSLQEEVCKLQRDLDEANNTSKDLQEKIHLQKQLNKLQSEDLENCKQTLQGTKENKQYLQEMMVEKNKEIARIEAELVQTKANLEEQEQLTRKSLEQVSAMEEQEKKEKKMEERELEKLENLIHHLETIIDKYQIEQQSMKDLISSLQEELRTLKEKSGETERTLEEVRDELEKKNRINKKLEEEVCKVQRDLDEANNTSRDLQKELHLQKQLNKLQSEDLENCKQTLQGTVENKQYLQEMMVEKNTEIARIEAELVQTKANLEEQEQLTRKSLEQVSAMGKQEKKEKKMEERELEKLENLIQHLETIIDKYQIERQSMKDLISSLQEELQTLKEKSGETERIMEEVRDELEKKNMIIMKLEEELIEAKKEQNLNLQDIDLLISDLQDEIDEHQAQTMEMKTPSLQTPTC